MRNRSEHQESFTLPADDGGWPLPPQVVWAGELHPHPHPKPDMQVSKHPAFQMFLNGFQQCRLLPTVSSEQLPHSSRTLSINKHVHHSETKHPAALRHVVGFPNLRLLRRLRHPSASLLSWVVTVIRESKYEASDVFPGPGSNIRHPLSVFPSLHRVLRDQFPGFISTMKVLRRPAAIPPHFVSFAWRYLGCTRSFRSRADECAAKAWSW